jgi:hypothetical protein
MRDVYYMRTTLNLDPDVLEAAKMLAAKQRRPLGAVVSDLLRRAVVPPPSPPRQRNGIPLFPIAQGARAVTPEVVKELLEETL